MLKICLVGYDPKSSLFTKRVAMKATDAKLPRFCGDDQIEYDVHICVRRMEMFVTHMRAWLVLRE